MTQNIRVRMREDIRILCYGCSETKAVTSLSFGFLSVYLCWSCAMDVRNGIERERLQKHEYLDEMERLEVETALEWSTGLDQ